MRYLVSAAMLATLLAGTGHAQEFYGDPADLPQSGRDLELLNACWAGLGERMGGAPLQAEAVMIPEYKPLTEARKARYGLTGPVAGMVYADVTFIVWTADNAGVAFPLAMRCEVPMDPDAPDFTRIHLSEDASLNPNVPASERPARQ